ncbi:MAG TPA: cupin domain-containing protein [Bryobacteraceae bacterium]|nr:cupin domain-containing protein [Bryobacteraceae bacterium]
MKYSRRDLHLLVPAAFAAGTAGFAQTRVLPSKTFKYEDLPVKVNGQNRGRAILSGKTHTGCALEMHETELGAGLAPHPPHHHVHEEMMLIREGDMEITIAGKVSKLGPGSVAYVASGEEHGWRNVGTTPARYFVIALGNEKS